MTSHSHKRGRSLLVALAVAAFGVLALGATGASAAEEIAKWQQSTSTMRWQGALTVDTPKTAPKSCTSLTANGQAVPGAYSWQISNAIYGWGGLNVPVLKASCEGGTQLMIKLDPEYYGASPIAYYDTVAKKYFLYGVFISGPTFTLPSPHGNYWQEEFTVPFTNGAGGSPSTVNFSNTKIGTTATNGELTLSGTITVDDGKGNPRTLTH